MTNAPALTKALLIYGIAIPVALFLGYALSTPTEITSLGLVGLVLGLMTIPFLLHWHHPVLVLTWNASLTLGFLPGAPKVWMAIACVSFVFTVLTKVMNREVKLIQVPIVTWTLLAFLAVVAVTAVLRGGIGVRALGSSSFGGKGYFLIAMAVIGYFALSTKRIPVNKAYVFIGLFFFGGLTSALSNIVYAAGPSFWWFFYVVPVDLAISQAAADFGVGHFSRLGGVALSMVGVYCFLLARYGIRGILDFQHPFRFITWALTVLLSLLGGFRSILVLYFVLFWLQFYFEGLFRTRLFPMLALAGVLGFAALVPMASRLPLSMQRTLSLVPLIEVDPVARMDAFASTDWRLRMWRAAWPQVYEYLLLGKGYVIDPTELAMVEEGRRRGFVEDFEASLVAGDYHSGPLSVLIPLGLAGSFAFIAFTVACVITLYRNYRYGDPRLKLVNTLLLSLFIARTFSFWVIFGHVTSGLAIFCGLIGMSVALNGGVAEQKPESVNHATA